MYVGIASLRLGFGSIVEVLRRVIYVEVSRWIAVCD
jgi:hypothetical protein